MSNLASRLLVFIIGVPVALLIVLVNIFDFLPLKITIIFVSFVLALEIHNILSQKLSTQPKRFILFLTVLIPLSTILDSYIDAPLNLELISILFSITLVLVYEIFSKKALEEKYENTLQRITSSLFVFFYAGYLMSFFIKMTKPEWIESSDPFDNSLLFSLFLIIVFGTDSLAWFFGMLFGKNNRGIVKASPNKSIAGFVGGILGTVIVVFLVVTFVPSFNELLMKNIVFVLCISFITSLMAIIGDLIESVIKRSANVKDSGKIMAGRGGLFDSMDSILISAPVFYLLIECAIK